MRRYLSTTLKNGMIKFLQLFERYKPAKYFYQQIIDFAVLEVLISYGKNTPDYTWGLDKAYLLDEWFETLCQSMRETLLESVFWAIVEEFSHVYDQLWAEGLPDYTPDWVYHFEDAIAVGGYRGVKSRARQALRDALVWSDWLSKEDLVKDMKWVYENANWEHEYGGPAWASICDGWFRLNKSKSGSKLVVAIDHILDLQHNTASLMSSMESLEVYEPGLPTIHSTLELRKEASPDVLLKWASKPIQVEGSKILRAFEREKEHIHGS